MIPDTLGPLRGHGLRGCDTDHAGGPMNERAARRIRRLSLVLVGVGVGLILVACGAG